MKILWHSTVPWGGSSYSVLTTRTVPGIVRLGHAVQVSTWYGLQGAPQRWNIYKDKVLAGEKPASELLDVVTVLPCADGTQFGRDVLLETYKMIKAEVIMPCMDIWVLPPALVAQAPMAPWLPIDHDPAPQPVVDAVQPAIYPMVYSQWGVDVLEKAGVKAHYVPCSADAEVFAPMDKAEARRKLGVPDSCDFLVSMVAANKDPQDRKGFAEGLMGYAEFVKTHPNAVLYIHTHWGGAINIDNLTSRLGITKKTMRPEPLPMLYGMYSEDFMRTVYSASDVLLNPAKSEGFGLPLIEAQMCGCPIAATNFSTTAELMAAGYLIEGQPCWSYGADSFRITVSPGSVRDALEAAYEDKGNELLRAKARAGVLKYDTETVMRDYWKPALDDIEAIIGKKTTGKLELVTF